MHTEHLQNVKLGRVALAWLVAAAVTSFAWMALAGLGVIQPEGSEESGAWALAAVAVGFWFGGLFAGLRSARAPILHGVAIGLLSLVVWFVLNVIATVAWQDVRWQGLGPAWAAALILLQMLAAVLGAWAGRTVVRREGMNPDLAE